MFKITQEGFIVNMNQVTAIYIKRSHAVIGSERKEVGTVYAQFSETSDYMDEVKLTVTLPIEEAEEALMSIAQSLGATKF